MSETADLAQLAERVARSKANRAALEQRFGFVPLSILRGISRGALSNRVFLYQREEPVRNAGKSEAAKVKAARLKAVGVNGDASRKYNGRGHPGASVMPAELVDFFARYYARPGAAYLDPFMGQGVQMQVAKLLGMHYYGYDLSTEFFRYVAAVKEKIDDGATTISVTHGDSRYPDAIADGTGDFCFTSPPYWDIEFYGDEPGQLGYRQSYEGFLSGMEEVARAWRPKFKADAYVVVNVGDFRKNERFYCYHADTIALYERAGYTLHDLWVIDGLVGGLARAFAVDFNLKRIAPRVHEYALVFRP